jgi:hypothetical protein
LDRKDKATENLTQDCSVLVEIRNGKFPFACQTLLAESVRVINVGPTDGETALKNLNVLEYESAA